MYRVCWGSPCMFTDKKETVRERGHELYAFLCESCPCSQIWTPHMSTYDMTYGCGFVALPHGQQIWTIASGIWKKNRQEKCANVMQCATWYEWSCDFWYWLRVALCRWLEMINCIASWEGYIYVHYWTMASWMWILKRRQYGIAGKILLCKAKRQHLLTCKLSRCCLLVCQAE